MTSSRTSSVSAERDVGPPSAGEIRDWILERLKTHTNIPHEELRIDEPITSFGVDSMQFVGLIGELEEWLGCRILDNPLPQYSTIEALSAWLGGELAAGRTQLNPQASLPTHPRSEPPNP